MSNLFKSTLVLTVFCVVSLRCSPPTTIPDANSDSNTNDNTGTDTDAERFRLTVNWAGEGFGTSFLGAAVWVFVGDDTILRANGDYREGVDTRRFIKTANDPRTSWDLDVDAGKFVTLVAFEDQGVILNLAGGAIAPASSETTHIEFLEWSGDINATPEAGVATVLMNADKDVTVTYAPMPTLEIDVAGSGFFLQGFQAPEWLNDPALGGISPVVDCTGDECETQCLGSSTFSGPALFYSLKGGTILELTSMDCLVDQLDWDMWTKAGCAGRECSFQFGNDSNATATWEAK